MYPWQYVTKHRIIVYCDFNIFKQNASKKILIIKKKIKTVSLKYSADKNLLYLETEEIFNKKI